MNEISTKDRLKLVEEQFHMWKSAGPKKAGAGLAGAVRFITVSREYGCAGFRIGDRLAAVLNELQNVSPGNPPWTVYDRKLVESVCADHNLSHTLVETLDQQRKNMFGDYITGIFTGEPSSLEVFKKIAQTIFRLAAAGRVILIGRASSLVTRELAGGLHVRICASLDWRVKKVAAYEKIESLNEARKYVQKQDKELEKFARDFMGHSVGEIDQYDLVMNQERLGIDRIVMLVLRAMELKSLEANQE